MAFKILNLRRTLQGRSLIVIKNALLSFFLKGTAIFLSFAIVPLYLNSVNKRIYGIILTITSVANFISFFDVGIGNGLRNKLGKALAVNDKILARKYVSTGYFYVVTVFTAFFALYCIVARFIDWHILLNIKYSEIPDLNNIFTLIIGLFALRFILQLIGIILLADQKSAWNDTMLPLTNLLVIAVFYLYKWMHIISFYSILYSMCGMPIVVLIIYTIILFSKKYKWMRPSFSYITHSLRGELLGLGFQFFLIQIVSIVIFSTTNILIAQLFNIEFVTTYNIAFKYYNVSVMAFGILLAPLWGAFTNAWYQNDVKWIESNIRKAIYINFILIAFNILQILVYAPLSKLWLKQALPIPFGLVISIIFYNLICNYNNIFAYFLAGIGNVKKQMYCAVVGGVLNIPLTICLAKYTSLGIATIVIANILCLLPSTVFTTFQTFNIIKNKKKELVSNL